MSETMASGLSGVFPLQIKNNFNQMKTKKVNKMMPKKKTMAKKMFMQVKMGKKK